jgi:uncharacterized protein
MRRLATGLAGILIAVATSTAASASAPSSTVAAEDRPITYVVDGTTTFGTLHVPAHRAGQRLAAALLLPGSGPTDRDGDQPPLITSRPLALIADVLGAQGIMSLRFDKYGTGQTGLGAYAGHVQDFDYSAQVRQAVAAYQFLAQQPEADRHALLVMGHSEGALTALMIATSASPRPAGTGLLQPLDVRFLDLVWMQLADQIDRAVAAGQIDSGTGELNKTLLAKVFDQARAGEPVDTTGLLPSLATFISASLLSPINLRYVRSIDALYPPDVARQLAMRTRVLVTCGTADIQVRCATTTALMASLRRVHTHGPELVVLSNVDHELQLDGTPTTEAVLAPAVVDAIVLFTRPWREPSE